MKLFTDFHPKWIGSIRSNSGEGLEFDCPSCGPTHRLAVYFNNPLDRELPAAWRAKQEGEPGIWKRIGEEFDTLTVHPSVQYPCFHGWIMLGVVIDVREATHFTERVVEGKKQKIALSPLQVFRFRATGKI